MIYTLTGLRAVVRGKDNRLEDIEAYPDSWVDDKIEHAFETAESAVAVFHTEQEYDCSTDILAGSTEVTITLNEEPHFIYLVTLDEQYFDYYITGTNKVVVTFKDDVEQALSKIIKIEYFYYPTLPFTEIEMGPEVYHFYRHCLYVNVYGDLRDKENEMYHQAQVDKFVAEGTFPLPFNFDKDQQEIKFGKSTWV